MCVTNSMAEVAGRNARRLRLNMRPTPTLEDLARAVRTYGLRWSTGSVGSFESGRTVGLTRRPWSPWPLASVTRLAGW